MKQDNKIKAIKKLINMLVVPKVNELDAGFQIRSVEVGLTSYGARNDEDDFQIYIDLTKEPDSHTVILGISHLIINVIEYIDTACEVTLQFSDKGYYFDSHILYTGGHVFRKTNNESILMITGGQ